LVYEVQTTKENMYDNDIYDAVQSKDIQKDRREKSA